MEIDYEEGIMYVEETSTGITLFKLKHDGWRRGKEILVNDVYGTLSGVGRAITPDEAIAAARAILAHFGEATE